MHVYKKVWRPVTVLVEPSNRQDIRAVAIFNRLISRVYTDFVKKRACMRLIGGVR